MRESTLQRQVQTMVRIRGGKAIKFHGSAYTESGIPDLLCSYRGRFVFFETKGPGGCISEIQEHRMAELIATGARGGVVQTVAMAEEILNEIDSEV